MIPHLTVSEQPIDVTIDLPIHARASHVVLIEEDEHGRWHERGRFALGA